MVGSHRQAEFRTRLVVCMLALVASAAVLGCAGDETQDAAAPERSNG